MPTLAVCDYSLREFSLFHSTMIDALKADILQSFSKINRQAHHLRDYFHQESITHGKSSSQAANLFWCVIQYDPASSAVIRQTVFVSPFHYGYQYSCTIGASLLQLIAQICSAKVWELASFLHTRQQPVDPGTLNFWRDPFNKRHASAISVYASPILIIYNNNLR